MKVKLVKNQDFFQITTKSVNEIVENDKVVAVEIEGYASTKDKDRGKDIVEPTAFKNALDLYMSNPVVLLQHDTDKPIGLVTQATIDSKGLYVKAKITEDTDGVFSKLKNKVLRAFSIGYRIKDYEINEVKDDQGDVTGWEEIIKDLELYEISVVSIPMNPYALTKSMANCFEKEAEMENEGNEAEPDKVAEVMDHEIAETENEGNVEENEESVEQKENEGHPTVVDLWAEEIEEQNLAESEENENEENVEEKAVDTEAESEPVENNEQSEETVSEPVQDTEISEETTDSSENGGEITPNEDETSQVEKAVNVELQKAQVFVDMQAKMVAQENKIAELSKKLENTAEVIKECVDVITKLNAMVENTVVKTGFSFEKPMAKKSGYGQIAQLAKSI